MVNWENRESFNVWSISLFHCLSDCCQFGENEPLPNIVKLPLCPLLVWNQTNSIPLLSYLSNDDKHYDEMRFCANDDEDDDLLSSRCDDDHLTKMRFSAWKPPHNTLFLNPLISTHIEEIFTPPKKYFCFSRSTCWLVGWCATSVNWARRTSQLMRSETLITRGDHSNRPDGHIWTQTEGER